MRDERTVAERLQLAFTFAIIFGASAEIRILGNHQYQAIDLALEGAQIAGLLGGYVTGLITGLAVSIPDMFQGKLMSMPLFAAAGILGALMHDLAPEKEDVWHFSPFVDLNLYRLLRQALHLNRKAIDRKVLDRAAFNLGCNAIVLITEALRWAVMLTFVVHSTFFIFEPGFPKDLGTFLICAFTTLLSVSLPIRIWSSFRIEKQLAAQRASLTEARLAALTNQINPHFLFNTLNSISTLIRIDPDGARSMILKLSKILRRLLRKAENFSPLREEISFIDDYLGIEIVRFGDKLRFFKDIDSRTLDRLVPSMILQPIVENSIKHGLSNKVDGGTIWLRTWLEGTSLFISVADNGQGMEESRLATLFEASQGVGVNNVNERLRVLFGSSYRMNVESRQGEGTTTVIQIPQMDSHASEAGLPMLAGR